MDPFLAEIRAFPFNFAPRGWAFCDGQLMPISQNTALFSLLGTHYGGDGRTTFALPDLQGAAPMAWGQGPGLSARSIGEAGGAAYLTLTQSELPFHTHGLNVSADLATERQPSDQVFASGDGISMYGSTGEPPASLHPQALSLAGGGGPHNNLMPYLTLNFCIALQGIYPPRG